MQKYTFQEVMTNPRKQRAFLKQIDRLIALEEARIRRSGNCSFGKPEITCRCYQAFFAHRKREDVCNRPRGLRRVPTGDVSRIHGE